LKCHFKPPVKCGATCAVHSCVRANLEKVGNARKW
jgi:hypothetical protein